MENEKKILSPDVIVCSLLDSVEKKKNITNKYSPSIYKAPSSLRNLSQSSFKPRVVSIGPLHRKDENLQAFEGRKADFVHDLLRNINSPPKETLQACVAKVATSMEKIKGCYAELKETNYTDDELAEMMVKDACFILEFIHRLSEPGYIKSKIIYHQIPYDLVLLENQIPFFVLDIIFQCTILKFEPNVTLIEFILPLLKFPNLFQTKKKVGISRPHATGRTHTTHDHILGLLHNCYKPTYRVSSYFPSSTIHSAVELNRAGVRFKPHQDTNWPMAMKVKTHRFSCFSWSWIKPSLSMPALHVNHFTELVLRNLIAYEQSSMVEPYVTSYAMAMDMLIDTKDDIGKLMESKVLINHLGSNEEAANMINKLCKELVWEYFFYGKEWDKLDKHCKRALPRKILMLRRTYFNSPWSIIALCAAIILFSLSVVQTIFAVKPARN